MIQLVQPIFGKEEKSVLSKIIDSKFLASGSYVQEFENKFAEYCGAKHGIAVSSGTTALHTALLACGIKPGDKVLTTPLTFIATSNSILFCGAKPIFADIDPQTFNLCPIAAEEAIKKEKNIKAILLVHLYGTPCDLNAFKHLKEKYNIKLIEDCAQAHGAKYFNKTVGSFGDSSAFSFYATKNISTGEGGIILTNNPEIDKTSRQLINHGREGHSFHTILGYNFRLTNLAAGIGIVQLKKLNKWNKLRQKNASFYYKNLKNLDFIKLPIIPDNTEPVFHLFTIRLDSGLRQKFIDFLTENKVGCGIYYPEVIYKQLVYKDLGHNINICIEAEKATKEIVSLPVHPALNKNNLEQIIDVIYKFKNKFVY